MQRSITAGNTYSTVATFEPAAGYKFDVDALKVLELKAEDFNGWTVEVGAATTDTSLVLNISRVADKAKVSTATVDVGGSVEGTSTAFNTLTIEVTEAEVEDSGLAAVVTWADGKTTFNDVPATGTLELEIASASQVNYEWADNVEVTVSGSFTGSEGSNYKVTGSGTGVPDEDGKITVTIEIVSAS